MVDEDQLQVVLYLGDDVSDTDAFRMLSLHFNQQESADNWNNGQCEAE
jgi:trehalose-6-phosphatase